MHSDYVVLRDHLWQKLAEHRGLTNARQKQSMDPASMALVFGPGLITAGLIPWILYSRSKKLGRKELNSLQDKLNKKTQLTNQEKENYKVLKQFEEGGEI